MVFRSSVLKYVALIGQTIVMDIMYVAIIKWISCLELVFSMKTCLR